MANFNCVTGAPALGQPFCPCLCCPCCLGDSFLSASSGITVTHYDAVVGKLAPVAIPLLVSLGPCFQPCYKISDATGVCCVATDPKRPSASSKPVVIFAKRTVADLSTYTAAFTKYGTAAMEGPGVRACFSFVDRDTDNTVVQFTWADSASDLPAVPADLAACYAGGPESDFCVVWGGWDAAVKEALEADPKCKYEFGAETRGFLKSPGAETAAGFATGSPPMIWISKRKIKPGMLPFGGTHFQYGTDMMYPAAPAALGIAEITADGPDATWSLRVFNDYNMGFKAHFPVPSCILCRMAFNVIPTWEPGKFAVGYNFSSKEYIEAAVASNPGNASYTPYFYAAGLIGPEPDFGKGMTLTAPKPMDMH
mmetsp:Transcript_17061/g.54822  ORF Transcript_17061/g.54822 Transcript_17061/m.54822 type:complete len:367 (-) Transcript_17061:1132-2232(-)